MTTQITHADGYLNGRHVVLLVCKYLMLFCHETKVWHNTKWHPPLLSLSLIGQLPDILASDWLTAGPWSQLWIWTWHDNDIVLAPQATCLYSVFTKNLLLFCFVFCFGSCQFQWLFIQKVFLSKANSIYFVKKDWFHQKLSTVTHDPLGQLKSY